MTPACTQGSTTSSGTCETKLATEAWNNAHRINELRQFGTLGCSLSSAFMAAATSSENPR